MKERDFGKAGRSGNRTATCLAVLLLMAWVFPLEACAAGKRRSSSKSPTVKRQAIPSYPSYLHQFRQVAGQVGVLVLEAPSGRLVWSHRPEAPLVPASVVKVLTTYAALKHLGPYHHFSTSVLAASAPQRGVVTGNVWLKSDGDPFFLGENAWSLAQKLRANGVREIRGGVYVDNSYFQPGIERICIDGHCSSPYNPVLSATALEFNTVAHQLFPGSSPGGAVPVECYVGPPGEDEPGPLEGEAQSGNGRVLLVEYAGGQAERRLGEARPASPPAGEPVTRSYQCGANAPDPAAYASNAFRNLLAQVGVHVRGPAGGGSDAPRASQVLARYESPPLKDVLQGLNRYSNNFMAEMLLRATGAAVHSPPGSLPKGVAVVTSTLEKLGVPRQEIHLDSGSGLSRTCRVSPRAFGAVLLDGYRDFSIAPEFITSMATNGDEGTLRKRLRGTALMVRGKTGTLRDVIGFAGYVAGPDNRTYVVAVLLNDVSNRWEARRAIDDFLVELPRLAGGMVQG